MDYPYTLLQTLHRQDQKQFMEWSIELNNEAVFLRYKPTIYLYPDSTKLVYEKLSEVLEALKAPEKLRKVQQQSASSSMYQGIRISESETVDNCLYIHEQDQSFIHAYRWKNDKYFDKCFYRFGSNENLKQIDSAVHPELSAFYEALKKGKEYNRLFGNWIQENEEGIQEVYLSFPSRPTLEWVLTAFKPIISNEIRNELLQFKSFRFKNIGFNSSLNNKNLTIYFSFPVPVNFPDNHQKLTYYTGKYFANERLSSSFYKTSP